MPTLVIIDIQKGFEAANNRRLKRNVIKQIRNARSKSWGIVLVEYNSFGETYPSIRKALSRYSWWSLVEKDTNDGSKEVLEKCRQIGYDDREFFVVGVCSDFCVKETARGLCRNSRHDNTKVTVIKSACNSKSSPTQQFNWQAKTDLAIALA